MARRLDCRRAAGLLGRHGRPEFPAEPAHARTAGPETFTQPRRGLRTGQPVGGDLGPRRPSVDHRAHRLSRHPRESRPTARGTWRSRSTTRTRPSVQDGLLGLALHPDLLAKAAAATRLPRLHLRRRPRRRGRAAAARAALHLRRRPHTLGSPAGVLDNLPAADDHGGGRLAIGPDGKLLPVARRSRRQLPGELLPPDPRAGSAERGASRGPRLERPTRARSCASNSTARFPPTTRPSRRAQPHLQLRPAQCARAVVWPAGRALRGRTRAEHRRRGRSHPGRQELRLAARGRLQRRPRYVFANWSASAPAPCASLKFDNLTPPASVPLGRNRPGGTPISCRRSPRSSPCRRGYDLAAHGNATIAPGEHRGLHRRGHSGLALVAARHRDAHRHRLPPGVERRRHGRSPARRSSTSGAPIATATPRWLPTAAASSWSPTASARCSDDQWRRTETLEQPGAARVHLRA